MVFRGDKTKKLLFGSANATAEFLTESIALARELLNQGILLALLPKAIHSTEAVGDETDHKL